MLRSFFSKSSSSSSPSPSPSSSSSLKVPKEKFSLENLKYLYSQLLREGGVLTNSNRVRLVEILRSIAELMIWGDQHNPQFFDFFAEKNILSHFVRILLNTKVSQSQQNTNHLIAAQSQSPNSTPNTPTIPTTPSLPPPSLQQIAADNKVKVQIIQTLSILIQNTESEISIFYLLSNNYINDLIVYKGFDFMDEELLAYYINFLKSLSFKLNLRTVLFLFSPSANDFPLFTESLKFFNHPESMVRIAVRTLTLNVMKVEDLPMRKFIISRCAIPYFSNLVWFLRDQTLHIHDTLEHLVSSPSSISRLEQLTDNIVDLLFYFQDIIDIGSEELSNILIDQLLAQYVLPVLVGSLNNKYSYNYNEIINGNQNNQKMMGKLSTSTLSNNSSFLGGINGSSALLMGAATVNGITDNENMTSASSSPSLSPFSAMDSPITGLSSSTSPTLSVAAEANLSTSSPFSPSSTLTAPPSISPSASPKLTASTPPSSTSSVVPPPSSPLSSSVSPIPSSPSRSFALNVNGNALNAISQRGSLVGSAAPPLPPYPEKMRNLSNATSPSSPSPSLSPATATSPSPSTSSSAAVSPAPKTSSNNLSLPLAAHQRQPSNGSPIPPSTPTNPSPPAVISRPAPSLSLYPHHIPNSVSGSALGLVSSPVNRRTLIHSRLALYLLNQIFQTFRHYSFVNSVVVALFHPHPPSIAENIIHHPLQSPIKSEKSLANILFPKAEKVHSDTGRPLSPPPPSSGNANENHQGDAALSSPNKNHSDGNNHNVHSSSSSSTSSANDSSRVSVSVNNDSSSASAFTSSLFSDSPNTTPSSLASSSMMMSSPSISMNSSSSIVPPSVTINTSSPSASHSRQPSSSSGDLSSSSSSSPSSSKEKEKELLSLDQNNRVRSRLPDVGPLISLSSTYPEFHIPSVRNPYRDSLLNSFNSIDERDILGAIEVIYTILQNDLVDKELLQICNLYPQRLKKTRKLLDELTADNDENVNDQLLMGGGSDNGKKYEHSDKSNNNNIPNPQDEVKESKSMIPIVVDAPSQPSPSPSPPPSYSPMDFPPTTSTSTSPNVELLSSDLRGDALVSPTSALSPSSPPSSFLNPHAQTHPRPSASSLEDSTELRLLQNATPPPNDSLTPFNTSQSSPLSSSSMSSPSSPSPPPSLSSLDEDPLMNRPTATMLKTPPPSSFSPSHFHSNGQNHNENGHGQTPSITRTKSPEKLFPSSGPSSPALFPSAPLFPNTNAFPLSGSLGNSPPSPSSLFSSSPSLSLDYSHEVVPRLLQILRLRPPPRLVTIQLMSSLLYELTFYASSSSHSPCVSSPHVELIDSLYWASVDDIRERFHSSMGYLMIDLLEDSWENLNKDLTYNMKKMLNSPINLLPIEENTAGGIPLEYRRSQGEVEKTKSIIDLFISIRMIKYKIQRKKEELFPLDIYYQKEKEDNKSTETTTAPLVSSSSPSSSLPSVTPPFSPRSPPFKVDDEIIVSPTILSVGCSLAVGAKKVNLFLVFHPTTFLIVQKHSTKTGYAVVQLASPLLHQEPFSNRTDSSVLHVTIRSSIRPHPSCRKLKGGIADSLSFTSLWNLTILFVDSTICEKVKKYLEEGREMIRKEILNKIHKALQNKEKEKEKEHANSHKEKKVEGSELTSASSSSSSPPSSSTSTPSHSPSLNGISALPVANSFVGLASTTTIPLGVTPDHFTG